MNQTTQTHIKDEIVAEYSTLSKDFFAAVLLVSLFVNVATLTTWLAYSLS